MRHIRKDLFAMSQAAFGELCGVTQATVSRWEDGILWPSLKELERIRAEAIRRGIEWDDSNFFSPSPATDAAA